MRGSRREVCPGSGKQAYEIISGAVDVVVVEWTGAGSAATENKEKSSLVKMHASGLFEGIRHLTGNQILKAQDPREKEIREL